VICRNATAAHDPTGKQQSGSSLKFIQIRCGNKRKFDFNYQETPLKVNKSFCMFINTTHVRLWLLATLREIIICIFTTIKLSRLISVQPASQLRRTTQPLRWNSSSFNKMREKRASERELGNKKHHSEF